MKVFLSVGSPYTAQQKAWIDAFRRFLADNKHQVLTVGNERAEQPILGARELIRGLKAVLEKRRNIAPLFKH